MISAKIIADSRSTAGARIVTFELQYQRFIHGEVMTHRVFSRNAMSSRAVPVAKMIAQVRANPAMPVHWGSNQPGMQADNQMAGVNLGDVRRLWLKAAENAADTAECMSRLGLHKQVANRILEPFQWMRTIVTATEWDNFFALRAHPDAQPEFQELARKMGLSMWESVPVVRDWSDPHNTAWHLPYVSQQERDTLTKDTLLKISAARCARVSYLTHDGLTPDIDKDCALFERLVGSVPLHASPIEHQAKAHKDGRFKSNNFWGWLQHRGIYEASKC